MIVIKGDVLWPEIVKFIIDKQTVMRKLSALLVSASILTGFGIFFTSCDDDEPPAKPKLSFETATLTVKESDADLIINVVLDKAATEDITIDYSISGTAVEYVTATANSVSPDYEITSELGEIEIDKGETTGTIEIDLYSDGFLEPTDETIEISIEDVDSDQIEITRDDDMVITVEQEDGLLVLLEWPDPSVTGQADMDLVLRVGQNTTTWQGVLDVSYDESFEGPEGIFIPKAYSFPAYGLSYVYYDGTLNPLEFTVTFADYTNKAFEAESGFDTFDVTYTTANINKWTSLSTTIVVQTLLKTNGVFGTPSAVTVPPAGSRIGSSDSFIHTLNRTSSKAEWAKQFQKLLHK